NRPAPTEDRARLRAASGHKKGSRGSLFYSPAAGGPRGRSDAEARTAAAGGGGVGVLDDELRALQVFLVVDLGAQQVLVAHGVNQQRDAVLAHGGVVLVDDLVEGEAVLETGAAAALHEHTQLQL